MMSAMDGTEQEMLQVKEAGAVDFLLKPITASTLFDAIIRVLAPQKVGPAAHARPAVQELTGFRALLVEDNEINQQIATAFLIGLGVEVEIAGNGRTALERLARGAPAFDLILMDIQMPEMDGYEATRLIRSREKPPTHIPIIAMTAHAMVEEQERALKAGMDDHIAKPIDPDVMVQTLVRHLRRAPKETTLPGIDEKGAMLRVSGNRRLLLDLWARFAAGYAEAAVPIRAALEKGETELARNLIHTLTGPGGKRRRLRGPRSGEVAGAVAGGGTVAGRRRTSASTARRGDSLCRTVAAAILSRPPEAEEPRSGGDRLWDDVKKRLLGLLRSRGRRPRWTCGRPRGGTARAGLSLETWTDVDEAIKAFDFPKVILLLASGG